MLCVSIIAIVSGMTFFRWFYFRFPSYSLGINTSMNSIEQREKLTNGSEQIILHYFGSHVIYVINILTNQGKWFSLSFRKRWDLSLIKCVIITGCRERCDRLSFRILTGFGVLVGMVLVNSYSGIVISSLTVPKMKKSIESLEDWAASDEVGVVLRSDVSTGEQILVFIL